MLGLLVDGDRPRLGREFRAGLRQHIHYLRHPAVGPVSHARHRGFASVGGLRNHLDGLVRHAWDIDPAFAASCREALSGVAWP